MTIASQWFQRQAPAAQDDSRWRDETEQQEQMKQILAAYQDYENAKTQPVGSQPAPGEQQPGTRPRDHQQQPGSRSHERPRAHSDMDHVSQMFADRNPPRPYDSTSDRQLVSTDVLYTYSTFATCVLVRVRDYMRSLSTCNLSQ